MIKLWKSFSMLFVGAFIVGAILNEIKIHIKKKNKIRCVFCGSESLYLEGNNEYNEAYVDCYLYCSDCGRRMYKEPNKHSLDNRKNANICD